MRNLPPLAQLRAFEFAARHSSFRKASAELGETPTAVSHQIRALEEFCGLPLFRRRPRPVALTEAGVKLFPIAQDGFDAFANAITAVREDIRHRPLKVTTTNGFAGRWLVPRLPNWRSAHPEIPLEIVGTDRTIDLQSGDVDVEIRYMKTPPPGLVAHELFRNAYILVASPNLLSGERLGALSLIESVWSENYKDAATWRLWLAMADNAIPDLPPIGKAGTLSFTGETHAIQALINGQGIGICSDILVKPELEAGTLVKAVDFAMPGFGFYLAHVPRHPR